ncbi:MAG: hypothetical protein FWB95_02225 [Treponema sp.]|nr:hypothetical protein [Treponema sp.]
MSSNFSALDLFIGFQHNQMIRLVPSILPVLGEFKCPAEESANCEKSLPTNARKNCGKTDIRINKNPGGNTACRSMDWRVTARQ